MSAAKRQTPESFHDQCRAVLAEEDGIRTGDGAGGLARQHKLGRLSARERIGALVDGGDFLEFALWAAHGMYAEWGAFPAAGVITGIGRISGRRAMVVANDATVKAGAFVPMTCKKILRAQKIAFACNLPLVYLVDSSGVFLPMQDEIFPDEDDFGRIFRNNAVLSAAGIPQFAAIMGNCVAGGAYLPVLCDKVLMTEGSGLYLAGPALVKAAIGQDVESEELGGARMHAELSGTVDFLEKDDNACLARLRSLVGLLPPDAAPAAGPPRNPSRPAAEMFKVFPADGRGEYDMRDLLQCILDGDSLEEYKAGFGRSLVCAYARLGGRPVAVVANQRKQVRGPSGAMEMPGVIYSDSADKAARFVMDANQSQMPLIFFQDVQGFMVGLEAEQGGIIRSGAKLVNAVSNSTVPKITVILGGSYGAGHYALGGKAFDPRFVFAWPCARYAVMGATQAAEVVFSIVSRSDKAAGRVTPATLRERLIQDYQNQSDVRYAAARGWVDAIIQPETTRDVLINAVELTARPAAPGGFRGGVMQV